MKLSLGALAFGVFVAAQAAAPVIGSLSKNGVLACTNLAPGSVATIEWGPSVTGPWTNNWAGLEAVTADSNGMIQVSVPMFYRVLGVPVPPPGMALIPAGSFTMGDTFSEGYGGELPSHTVYVSAFYMDTNEVSKVQWDEVYQWAITNGYSFDNPGSGKASTHPVQTINWWDAVKWCNARSEKEGLTPCYHTDSSQTTVYRSGQLDLTNGCVDWTAGYRLPTEAEWEKAARGGASGHRFPWSDVDTISHRQANYRVYQQYGTNSYVYDVSPTAGYHPAYATGGVPYTSPAGSFAANGYGLYDMAGNVSEWCWDEYDDAYYSASPETDPRGPAFPLDGYRVMRGGDWNRYAGLARCAYRLSYYPDYAYSSVGFRCVRGF